MPPKQTEITPAKRLWPHQAGTLCWLIVLILLPIATFLVPSSEYNHPAIWFSIVLFFLGCAWILQSRLIWGTLIGIGIGFVFDFGVSTQDPFAQLWLLTARISVGAIIGLMVGWIWDGVGITRNATRGIKPPRR